MSGTVEQTREKPWEKDNLTFNIWYRKKLQSDFGAVVNMINVTRDIIRNGENKGEMYQTLLSNIQESQSRLTKLLFELEEKDMELALKINDSICCTLEWAKKSEVSSLLPEIVSTKEVTKLVAEMLDQKKQSTDERKVEDLINIELKVGIGSTAQIRSMSVPRGSTLMDVKNTIPNLKKRKHVTFVRQGLKVEETTVLQNGDNIIAVVANTEGPFEGFDEPDEKTVPIKPISPPLVSKKKKETGDLLTFASNPEVADPLSFLNEVDQAEPESKSAAGTINIADIGVSVEPGVKQDNFNLWAEGSKPTVNQLSEEPLLTFDSLPEKNDQALGSNPFEAFEDQDEAPLITFDRFLVGDNIESNEKGVTSTKNDSLLGDDGKAQDNDGLKEVNTFPKFEGFS